MRSIRRPSHRNLDDSQPEVCDVCGTLVARSQLTELNIEGLRGRVACPFCMGGSLRSLGFRDYRAREGRRPQTYPTRLPPYGASTWLEEEES